MDSEEFRQLCLVELEAVYRMALSLSRDPEEADDLTQETYLRAFKGEHTFRLRDRGVRPWLFKILHNAFYTRVGRQKKQPVAVESLEQRADADDGDVTTGPVWDLASLDWEHVDDRLKQAIEDLPEHYRAVLLLWAVEGLRYREVADVLEVPLGTVMSRLYRARAILTDQLADLAAETGMRRDAP